MSNRFLSVLLLLWIIGSWYLYYELKYKPEQIQKQQQEKLEQEKQVELEEKKEVLLKKIDTKIETNSQDIKEKIELLKQKNDYYFSRILKDVWIFYFEELEWWLWLFNSSRKLWEFKKVNLVDLDIKEVISNNDYFYFKVWEKKYLYNLMTNKTNKLDFKLDIEYIKAWKNSKEFLFVTNLWTFVYSIVDNNFEYFNYFLDFVYYNDWYLWIVNLDDETRLKNLSLKSDGNNLIVYYNPNSKEKKIIYKTELDLTKIYLKNSKIYFENITWEEFELENLK